MKEANIVTLTEQKKITSKLEENKDGYIYVVTKGEAISYLYLWERFVYTELTKYPEITANQMRN